MAPSVENGSSTDVGSECGQKLKVMRSGCRWPLKHRHVSGIRHDNDLCLWQQRLHDLDRAHVQYAVEFAPDDNDGLPDIAEQWLQRYVAFVFERIEDIAVKGGVLVGHLRQDAFCGPWN